MPKLLSLLGLILAACTTAVVQDHQALPTEKLVIEVQSPSDFPRVDEPVLIPLAHLGSAATEDYRFTVGGQEIPSVKKLVLVPSSHQATKRNIRHGCRLNYRLNPVASL